MFLYPLGLIALGAVPAVVALHLFRRRFRPHVVSAVFLWAARDRVPLAGRKREKLRTSVSFWCETIAALCLALAFAGPRFFGAGEAVHLVVVLDGSASMAARGKDGPIADRARERVQEEIDALPSGSRVTLVESGRRPSILAGPAAFPAEAAAALEAWQPAAAAHALAPAVALGSQLAGGGRVLLVADRFDPDAWPAEIEIEALGEPLDNVAITHASRRRTIGEDGAVEERVDLTVSSYAAEPRSVRLALEALGAPIEERTLALAPRAREHVAFRLPEGAPLLRASIDADVLAIDDEAFLAPMPPRTLALASTLDAATARQLGLGAPDGSGSPIARWLASVPDTIEAPDLASAHLVIAASAPPEGASWCLLLEAPPGERTPWIGPFLLDRRHPLLDGVTLEGVVWNAPAGVALAGVPVVSAGGTPLLTEDEIAGQRRVFRAALDPAGSTLQRSPDWPILLANLAELRRSALPGPARTSLVVGESFRFHARAPATYRFEGPGGARTVEALAVLEIDEVELPGVYTLSDASGPLCEVAYSFCDAAESDLSASSAGRREATSAFATLHAGFSWIELVLVGAALALLLVDWRWLARAERRADAGTIAVAPAGERLSMGFVHPALLLLAIPLALAWWRTRSRQPWNDAVRLAIGLLLLAALAGPYLSTSTSGRDLVVVVDRSLSMPEGSVERALELVRLAEAERRGGDRVAVVAFGREPAVERLPSSEELFQVFGASVDREASDVGAALETALDLIPERRQGAILLVSDGESNGGDAIAVARRAFGRGVRIDVRDFVRPAEADLSVEHFDLPGEVAVGEPFQFNVWVRSDRRVQSRFVLRRGERVLSSGERVFEAGANRLVFRDVLGEGGVAEYQVELGTEDDRVPENNRGLGAVRVEGAAAVLVLNHDGAEDSLVRALRLAGLPVAVRTPEAARLDHVGLSAFRAVVLENVAYERIAPGARALRNFVLDHGGGLLVTGGPASFGVGGYHLSPVDDLLPVSMEMRQEHRKLAVAMAIALDRSGSMTAPVAGGRTKMDLANLGTAAAIELLSPMDSVAVIAVDSAHHVVQPLVDVSETGDIVSRVRRITSGGGGIFVRTALIAAGRQLEDARQINKHIILFSDAADSEEQEGCPEVIAELGKSGVTLSVIALGSERDADAEFLKRIAAQGGGEIYFTQDPADLPRLFALDTMTAARSTFVDQPTPVSVLPDMFGIGAVPIQGFPVLDGYNLTYLRPDAQTGIVTQDEYRAPIFAFQHRGLGRTATYAGQIGGTYGSALASWEGFGEFFVTAVRWAIGNEEPEELFPSVRREGTSAIVTVEIDPDAPVPPDTSQLSATLESASGERRELVLERTSEHLFEARCTLEESGVALGTVAIGGDRFVHLPPLALPYSPEYERSPDPERGRRLLAQIARESGGEVGVTADAFFRGERASRAWRLVSREALLAALVLLLIEIAARRLSLWGALGAARLAERAVPHARAWRRAVRKLAPAERSRPAAARAAVSPSAAPEDGALTPASASAEPDATAPAATPATTRAPAGPPAPSLGSALDRARRAADKKLGR